MYLNKLRDTIQKNSLIHSGDTVLVAVSGGVDSVSLLVGLHQLSNVMNYNLVVCHVEHGLRGEESKQDAIFVEKLAAHLKLPFELGEFQVNELANEWGTSIEATARRVRYEFLERMMNKYQANRVAVAHHADDQVETILMRVLRGTSVSGLAGMDMVRKWKQGFIIRPLLNSWKHELERFCEENNIAYRTDSTNYSTDYLRNKIRLELIPFIEHAYNPNIRNRMLILGDIVRMEDEWAEQQAVEWVQTHCKLKEHCTTSFLRRSFMELHVALQRRVIKLILYYLSGQSTSWGFIHIESIRKQIVSEQPNLSTKVANDVQLQCEYDWVMLSTSPEPRGSVEITPRIIKVTENDQFSFGPFRITTEVGRRPDRAKTTSNWEAYISLDQILPEPIQFRTRNPGDTISLFQSNGTSKVKKLMIDHKIPISLRDKWPLLEVAGNVIWIPGIKRSRHLLLNAETQNVIYIQVAFEHKS